MVTVVDPDDDTPGASAPTLRAWSGVSAASSRTLADRKNRVDDAGAASPPWLTVVSETRMFAPAAACGGALIAVTIRSGPTASDVSRVLFDSLVSERIPLPSAFAKT